MNARKFAQTIGTDLHDGDGLANLARTSYMCCRTAFIHPLLPNLNFMRVRSPRFHQKENVSGTHLQLKARNQTLTWRSIMPTRSMKSRSTGSGHLSLASARGKPRFGSETCLSTRQSASEEENTLDACCFLRKRWQFCHKRIWPVYYRYRQLLQPYMIMTL